MKPFQDTLDRFDQASAETRWLGKTVRFVESIDSTNSQLMRSAVAGEARHGTILIADRQTAGRGRLQRSWISPPGVNLYFSLLLEPPRTLSVPWSLVTGVAVAETVARWSPDRPQLKWPNDILLRGRKVAGILVESTLDRGQAARVVIGIGLNVNQTEFVGELAEIAISLALVSDRSFDRRDVLAGLVERLEGTLDEAEKGGTGEILRRWMTFAPWIGQRVTVPQVAGPVAGVARGLDATGALILELDDGHRMHVVSGDVFLAVGADPGGMASERDG